MDMDIEDKVRALLPEYEEHLRECIRAEKEERARAEKGGYGVAWRFGDVRVKGQVLAKLFVEGVLDMPYGATGKKYYCMVDLETTERVLDDYDAQQPTATEVRAGRVDVSAFDRFIEVRPSDRNVKEVMHLASASPGIHIALIGGPGTGKSLIASCIEKAADCLWVSATDMTKASLRDELMSARPRFVLIDELDKCSNRDAVQLLSEPMQDQTLSVQTSGKEAKRVSMPINVFATGNTMNFPSNIKDRFLVLRLKEYSNDEFKRLITESFPMHERIDAAMAERIAEEAVKRNVKSYRRCLAVASICPSVDDVEWVFETFDFD